MEKEAKEETAYDRAIREAQEGTSTEVPQNLKAGSIEAEGESTEETLEEAREASRLESRTIEAEELLEEATRISAEDVLFALTLEALEAPERFTAETFFKGLKALGLSELIEHAKAAREENEDEDGEAGDSEKEALEDPMTDDDFEQMIAELDNE